MNMETFVMKNAFFMIQSEIFRQTFMVTMKTVQDKMVLFILVLLMGVLIVAILLFTMDTANPER